MSSIERRDCEDVVMTKVRELEGTDVRDRSSACCSCLDTPSFPVCLMFAFSMNCDDVPGGRVWRANTDRESNPGVIAVSDEYYWHGLVKAGWSCYCFICYLHNQELAAKLDSVLVDADIIWHADHASVSLFLCNRHSCLLSIDHSSRPHGRANGDPCNARAVHIADARVR